MLWCSQLGEVLLAEGPRYTPVQQGLHHLGIYAHLQSERSSLHIVQLPLESTVACPCYGRTVGATLSSAGPVYNGQEVNAP